jgi:hypothetical protein
MLAPNEELRARLGVLQWLRVEMQWETYVLSVQRRVIPLVEAGELRCLSRGSSAHNALSLGLRAGRYGIALPDCDIQR